MLPRTLTAVLLALWSPMASANEVSMIDWLVGHWVGSTPAGIYETWFSNSSGDLLIGMAKMTSPDRNSVFFNEYDQIQMVDGHLRLQPFPNGEKGVTFDASLISGSRVIFENPGHAFPSKITYESSDYDHLTLTVEGQNGAAKQVFLMQRNP